MKYVIAIILSIQAVACFVASFYLYYRSIIAPSGIGIKTVTSVGDMEFKGYIAFLFLIAGLGIIAYLKRYFKIESIARKIENRD